MQRRVGQADEYWKNVAFHDFTLKRICCNDDFKVTVIKGSGFFWLAWPSQPLLVDAIKICFLI